MLVIDIAVQRRCSGPTLIDHPEGSRPTDNCGQVPRFLILDSDGCEMFAVCAVCSQLWLHPPELELDAS